VQEVSSGTGNRCELQAEKFEPSGCASASGSQVLPSYLDAFPALSSRLQALSRSAAHAPQSGAMWHGRLYELR